MPRFFLKDIGGETAIIYGEDARHIAKSLRMKEGDLLSVCDTKGFDYNCKIEFVSSDEVRLLILEKTPTKSETKCKLRLFQAIPKGDKMDFIAQKACELGVDEIVPVVTARCISRPSARGGLGKKHARLNKIVYEAAKQSGRGKIPNFLDLVSFETAIEMMRGDDLAIICYEEATAPLHEVLTGDPQSISILIGSEGGFSVKEVEAAIEAGLQTTSLGSRILRCETASVAALSGILFYLKEF